MNENNITIYEDREFMIFNVSELNLVDFTKVHETSAETVRKSVDGTKTFCKWDGSTPDFFNSMTTKEGPYSYTQILAILATPEWTDPNPLT